MSSTDQFRALINAQKAPLPWTPGEDGSVFDVNGDLVLQVDPDNDRPNLKVAAIARHLVTAINASGGFMPASEISNQKGNDDAVKR